MTNNSGIIVVETVAEVVISIALILSLVTEPKVVVEIENVIAEEK